MARILVAEDDEALLKSLGRFLRKLGHEVVEAHDGRHAMTEFRRGEVDLIVTDINMPDIDGLELLTAVREEAAQVHVIVMSGGGVFPQQLLLDHAEMLGAFTTIAKPLDLDVIRAAVESAVGPGSRGPVDPN